MEANTILMAIRLVAERRPGARTGNGLGGEAAAFYTIVSLLSTTTDADLLTVFRQMGLTLPEFRHWLLAAGISSDQGQRLDRLATDALK